MVGKGHHRTSLHTPCTGAHAQVLSIFHLSFSYRFPCALDVHGSLRLLLVSMWLFRAVHSVLQPARSRMPHGISRRFACRLGIYVDEVLRAAYGAAENECVSVDVVDLRKLQTWFLRLQIRSSQPYSLNVRREARASRLYRHADCLQEILRSNVTLASRVLRDGLCHDRDALVHHTIKCSVLSASIT